ncbi:hypothetical protein STRTUCAR8_08626 [Streptomyces turgidiscabies Car8]|uniref:Uncharacterized protein n=1 Tax=Streptomyces turgidiscabies (strain Car8) TaxID=698760 RepID=L7F9H9_STRT8|nr:hypothetical protein [Streptomyces turgidiscabies]ELP67696.1 hypothetical protein STRTUCAR8_08626 [Streptomyces turgidiscabies Car8]
MDAVSPLTACGLIAAVLFLVAVFFAFALCRAAGRPAPARQPQPPRAWDFTTEDWVDLPAGAKPGPGQMTPQQIEDADDLDLLYLSRPFDPATDPQWAAGRERLYDAARDHQKGDQA